MKLLLKISCVVVIIAICALLCHIVYLWATYIDEAITSGEGYGLKIGDTKEQVYHKAGELFKDKKVYFLHPIDERRYGPHKELGFSSDEYEMIKDRDLWEFYFTEDYFDSITFTFRDDHLIRIYRHRKKFELP